LPIVVACNHFGIILVELEVHWTHKWSRYLSSTFKPKVPSWWEQGHQT